MPTQTKERKNPVKQWFLMCPVRHILLLAALLLIGAYFALRGNHGLMQHLSEAFVRPCHRVLGSISELVPFSVAELIYGLLIVAAIVYIIIIVVKIVRCAERLKRLYKLLLTLLTAAAVFYAGFCLLWGVYYYGDSFSEKIQLEAAPVSVEELTVVTQYFAQIASTYSGSVPRDENGCFAQSRAAILERGKSLYTNVGKAFPALAGREFSPKPVRFSKVMSMIQFTGFFFPFTGEANLNMDSPACLLPSTVAHELAHQRGVAREQEANFVAVLASMESGDSSYIYSSALLAYIHLGNALYAADYEAWLEAYSALNTQVRADLAQHNTYWDKYEDTAASKASDAVYTGFLHSYGQTLGLKSYGACVDLLVAYYYEEALEAIQ